MDRKSDLKQSFSVASNRDEAQKRMAEDQERLRQVEQIRAQQERDRHVEAIRYRDEKLKAESDRAKRKEEEIAQREIRNRVAAKHELQLTMKGAAQLSPKQQENLIREAVRNTHGVGFDQGIDIMRNDMNREIDKGIKESLERQKREQEKPEVRMSLDERKAKIASQPDLSKAWERKNDEPTGRKPN